MRGCNGSSAPSISLNGMPSGERTLGLGRYRKVGLFRPFTRKAETGDKCVEDEGKDGQLKEADANWIELDGIVPTL